MATSTAVNPQEELGDEEGAEEEEERDAVGWLSA
jgi:hypothetical protein